MSNIHLKVYEKIMKIENYINTIFLILKKKKMYKVN